MAKKLFWRPFKAKWNTTWRNVWVWKGKLSISSHFHTKSLCNSDEARCCYDFYQLHCQHRRLTWIMFGFQFHFSFWNILLDLHMLSIICEKDMDSTWIKEIRSPNFRVWLLGEFHMNSAISCIYNQNSDRNSWRISQPSEFWACLYKKRGDNTKMIKVGSMTI